MKTKIKEINWMIVAPVMLTIILWGGFHTYSVLATGILTCGLLIWKIKQTKKCRSEKSYNFYGMLLLCIAAVLSIFTAVDKGMVWYGVLRVLSFGVWGYYLMQFSDKERESALEVIPYIGAVMVAVGSMAYLIPGVKELFWQAERFGGLYQYSNTCSLFLLIGIIINIRKRNIPLLAILSWGIFITGSRGGILFLLIIFGWYVVMQKDIRKYILFILGGLLTGGLAYGFLSGNFQNIARIYTIFEMPTTLLERALYMIDAIPLILKYPLGMGYMGYASVQPAIQNGIYTTLFVHNEWLQMTLDYGILFLIVSLLLVGKQITKGNQTGWKKAIIIIICIYSLLEFHFQYFSILMLLSLCWELEELKMSYQKKAGALENQIFAGIVAVVFVYFATASFLSLTGNVEAALKLYPDDTQALEAVLLNESDKDTAVQMAKHILELNSYNVEAYNVLSYAALMDGNLEVALEQKLRILEIERYNMEEYKNFVNLNQSILLSSNGDENIIKICENAMVEMENLLAETKSNVNPIAYELREIPIFTWE